MKRNCAVAGMISSVGFLILWIISALLAPSWQLGSYSLSDLGVCGDQSAELCFNLACGLSGSMAIIFSLGVTKLEDNFRYCGFVTLISGFALICIGVITLRYGIAHNIVAGIYFLTAVISVILSIYLDRKDGRKGFSIFDGILFFVMLISALTQVFEVYEPIVVSCILVWTFAHSYRLFLECTD